MKTVPMMLKFLPRFRWFAFGFGLATTIISERPLDGILIMFILGFITYAPEAANQRLADNQKRMDRSAEQRPGEERQG